MGNFKCLWAEEFFCFAFEQVFLRQTSNQPMNDCQSRLKVENNFPCCVSWKLEIERMVYYSLIFSP